MCREENQYLTHASGALPTACYRGQGVADPVGELIAKKSQEKNHRTSTLTTFRFTGMGFISDAMRESPTHRRLYPYIDISPFYGMAPATVSGYRSGGRRYA